MRATIRQIALEAGVSNVTVSNVLRGLESRASPAVRARVLEAAQKLNYIPIKPPTTQNYQAQTRVVTLVPEHHDARHFDLDLFTYQGVIEGARRYGYSVLTMVREENQRGTCESLRFLDRSSDGFIFTVSLQEQWGRVLDAVAHNRVPSVVCYNRQVPDGVAWVDVDNAGAMRQAVEYLAARGHSQIAFVAGPPDNFDARERRREWQAAMEELNLEAGDGRVVQGARAGFVQDDAALRGVAQMGVTAAVCFNDTLALALWEALEAAGKCVPEDLSILGMDDRPEAQRRGLSTLSHSFIDVGRLAVDAWMELKNGAAAADCCKTAPVALIERDSVATLKTRPVSAPNSKAAQTGAALNFENHRPTSRPELSRPEPMCPALDNNPLI